MDQVKKQFSNQEETMCIFYLTALFVFFVLRRIELHHSHERYENCLFSAEVYSDVIKDMSVIAKEDIEFASRKVDRIAQMYRVYPQMLKKQTDSIISHQSHLNNNEDKQQLQAFFKELLETIDNSLESANESVNVLRERQAVQELDSEKKYSINYPAFRKIESYKYISKKL